MKKSYIVSLALLFSGAVNADVLVGSVNIQKVIVTVKEGEKVIKKLKGSFEDKQKLLKKDEEKIIKMKEDLKKQSLVMNDKAKIKKESEIEDAIRNLQQQSMEYQKEIQNMEQDMKGPILDKVKTIIDEVSKTAGVDVTFEASTAPVIYAKNKKDLTDEVIKMYDSKYPAK